MFTYEFKLKASYILQGYEIKPGKNSIPISELDRLNKSSGKDILHWFIDTKKLIFDDIVVYKLKNNINLSKQINPYKKFNPKKET